MANENTSRKKPRVRKSVPTVRELTQSGSESPKPKKRSWLRVFFRTIAWPFVKVFGANTRLGRLLRRILRPLSWLLRKLVPRYFVNSWRELKLVTWPGRRETWRLTAAVFVFAIVFGSMIYAVDLALDKLFRETVLK